MTFLHHNCILHPLSIEDIKVQAKNRLGAFIFRFVIQEKYGFNSAVEQARRGDCMPFGFSNSNISLLIC